MLRLFGLDLAVTRFGIGSIVFDILGGLICCFISHLLYTFSLHVQVDISLSLMDENVVCFTTRVQCFQIPIVMEIFQK